MIRVPEADKPSASAQPETTGISSSTPPAPHPVEPAPAPVEPAPSETGTEVTASEPKSSSAVKPPPLKSTSKRVNNFDDGDDDDEDEDRPSKKKRRRNNDDDNDDDDLDVRNRRGRSQSVNSMAMTSMIMGIVSVTSLVALICCCGMFGAGVIGAITGILALTFGYMGKTPGSEGYAMTGIICGAVGTAVGVMELIAGIAIIGLQFGLLRN